MPAAESEPDGSATGGSGGARRVAAIAFADVVGYSTLMAADERGTYTRWMALLRGLIEPQTALRGGSLGNLLISNPPRSAPRRQ